MSVFDTLWFGPVNMVPGVINSDCVAVELVGEGIYISDNQINIPVRLWEEMQATAKALEGLR